jgi:hypothetical protein
MASRRLPLPSIVKPMAIHPTKFARGNAAAYDMAAHAPGLSGSPHSHPPFQEAAFFPALS